MKLFVLDNGSNENDYSFLWSIPALATPANHHPPAVWVKVPVYSVLIQEDDCLVLYDTGCCEDYSNRWDASAHAVIAHNCTKEQNISAALGRLGIRCEDVTHVVASHLHADHAGNLELFPNAEIYVHEHEFDWAMRLYALNGAMHGYCRNDIQTWLDKKLKWRLVYNDENELALSQNIKILNLGSGHAHGQLGLMVHLPKTGTVILPADAIGTESNYSLEPHLPGDIFDSVGYVRCIRKIRNLQQSYQGQVWFGHDAEQFQRLIKSDEGYYD